MTLLQGQLLRWCGKLLCPFQHPLGEKKDRPKAVDATMQAYWALLPKYDAQELVIPFGEFLEKHGLQAMVHIAFTVSQGLCDILNVPTIYVMQNFGLDVLKNIQTGFLTTVRGDNSQTYEKATAELVAKKAPYSTLTDKDGYLSVTVKARNSPHYTVVRAKQILVPIPPTVEKFAPCNLDATESPSLKSASPVGDSTTTEKNKVITGAEEEPEFVTFSDHSPFEMKVDAAHILWEDVWLQGERGTWWTGAAWLTQDSSLLWQFTEKVLARIVSSLVTKYMIKGHQENAVPEAENDIGDIQGDTGGTGEPVQNTQSPYECKVHVQDSTGLLCTVELHKYRQESLQICRKTNANTGDIGHRISQVAESPFRGQLACPPGGNTYNGEKHDQGESPENLQVLEYKWPERGGQKAPS
ncbi:hypothetical protein EV426DRAFT_640321 [Tirmania nivea]|nr:hypothetical protein EV426DRAFT_640321 [Tirmania nivea]